MLALLDSRRPRIAHEKYHVACECGERGIHGILLAPSHDLVALLVSATTQLRSQIGSSRHFVESRHISAAENLPCHRGTHQSMGDLAQFAHSPQLSRGNRNC